MPFTSLTMELQLQRMRRRASELGWKLMPSVMRLCLMWNYWLPHAYGARQLQFIDLTRS